AKRPRLPAGPLCVATQPHATPDPVSLAYLDDELADLRAEHTDIRHALIGRFNGMEHHHI
ncbi:hypothetical protein ACFQ7J_27435, partial [Streptomyces sp. NPDC056501]|uniref:hypothetical protein n=1 Tax=Streptomyces sp. NPDC056501 TaxID=3345841 RepID=UPI00369642CB